MSTSLNYHQVLLVLSVCILNFGVSAIGQTENRFANEVATLVKKTNSDWKPDKETIVFTGSSSVRMWKNLQELFPKHQIINTGFGGSQASDLLYFLDDVVLSYQPTKVFIYEGDNDLWDKKRISEIIWNLTEIISRIHQKYPSCKIILISAKPSISRWTMKRKYKRLNKRMKTLATKTNCIYADVWNPMLNGTKLNPSIYIEDGLHMNAAGYTIWQHTLTNLITNP